MKKIKKILCLFLIILASFSLFSCDIKLKTSSSSNSESSSESNPSESLENTICYVTFVKNNGEENEVIEVTYNETLTKPADPEKYNYIFDGWFKDEDLTDPYSFSLSVTSSFSLYAKFIVDSQTIINSLSLNYIKATGSVVRNDYNKSMLSTTGSTSTGSAVIFYEDDTYYYTLTNCHVTHVSSDNTYKNHKYSFTDYLSNEYDATLVSEDASYDLAIVKFEKEDTELLVIEREDTNPIVSDYVESIGNPNGQANTITLGNISSVNAFVTISSCSTEESNVAFEVLKHNCYIDHGSSGGALLDTNFKLIGINYAGSTDEDGNFVVGYAIPIVKVNEFLNSYFFANN